MTRQTIEGSDYRVEYEPADAGLLLKGSLRLNGLEDYIPIFRLLIQAVEEASSMLVLNLQELQMLNSSGIAMLAKFVIAVRNKNIALRVIGSQQIPWQSKSLRNLQKLMPSLNLEII